MRGLLPYARSINSMRYSFRKPYACKSRARLPNALDQFESVAVRDFAFARSYRLAFRQSAGTAFLQAVAGVHRAEMQPAHSFPRRIHC
ncbi:hypothetical protein BH18ACT14_BH18ACT14_16470 [soil metagenome]